MNVLKKDFINKKVFISIILIFLIVFGFVAYKIYYFNKYNISNLSEFDYQELINKLEYRDTIIVKKRELNKKEDYLSFDNIKIKNDFNNYKEFLNDNNETKDYKSYKLALYDGDRVIESFWISKYKTYTSLIKNSESIDLFDVSEGDKKDDFYKRIILDYNINTDLELFEFLKNNEVQKVNVFSNPYDIKLLYSKALFFTVSLPSIDYLTKIEGDYSGYIVNSNAIKEVNIEIGEDKYILTFIDEGNKFTKEYINELLNTLVIEED